MLVAWNRKRAGIATQLLAVASLVTVYPSGGETPASPAETRVTQAAVVTAQQAGTTRVTQAAAVTAQQAGTTRVTQAMGVGLQSAGTTRVTQTFALILYTLEPPGIGSGDCPLGASYALALPCVHAGNKSSLTRKGSYVLTGRCVHGLYDTTMALKASYAPSASCVHGMFGDEC